MANELATTNQIKPPVAVEEKKEDKFKASVENFGKNVKTDAEKRAKTIAYGVVSDIFDIIGTNFRKAVSDFLFPDGSGPKDWNRSSINSDSGSYRAYASYSQSRRERQESLSNRSSQEVRLVTWPNEAQARDAIDILLKKIDESANNCARLGDLYELGNPKVATSMMDWKYGWTDQDKGQFDIRLLTNGLHAGEWMAIVPKPHIL